MNTPTIPALVLPFLVMGGILVPVLHRVIHKFLADDDVDEMMAVNVKSALYGMQTVLPHFLQHGDGHIINISSFLGRYRPQPEICTNPAMADIARRHFQDVGAFEASMRP